MVSFKNTNIFFARDEVLGARKIEQLLLNVESIPTAQLVQQIRMLGDESKLILDPDLDSYYIMYATVVNLPHIYSYFSEYSNSKVTVQKKETLKTLIRTNLEEMSLGIETAFSEDKVFYGTNAILQSKEYLEAYKQIIKLANDNLEADNSTSILTDIKNFWEINNTLLIKLLNQREAQLVKERNEAIGITSGLWLFSFILVVYFARAVLNKQKILYEEIEQKNVRLSTAAKMSSLGEMAGGVAHEINTPLAVIQVRTEQMLITLSEDPIDKEQLSEAAQIIEKTVCRIAQIVKGLKNFSRDGSNMPMVMYSVTDIVNETFGLCKERFRNNNIKLDYFTEQNYEISCHPIEISQVLLNLFNNSFDAVQTLTEKWVKVEATQTGDFVTLSVTDSGLGISKEVQAKMMQPFFTTKEIGKGTGLGLSISSGLITSQGGEMYLDTESKNTKFIIKLRHARNDNSKGDMI